MTHPPATRSWRRRLAAGALVGALAFAADAQQLPQLLTVQGYLTDTGGAPVTATALTVQVTLYDDATGTADSNRLYQVIRRVDVRDGNFSMLLGRPPGNLSDPVIDPSVFARPSLWLGVAVGSDPEMSPRLRITAVPFAIRAGTADTLQGRAPRACPAGSLDMRTYCIDATARTGRATEGMEACWSAGGYICGMQELYLACRRARTNALPFTPVVGEWIYSGTGEWHHPDTSAPIMACLQFNAGAECIAQNSVCWAGARQSSPMRYYCCYDPSPTARGD